MLKPGLFQNSMRTTVSGRHNSGAGNGKGLSWGWLEPSLWVIMETLSPDAAERDWLTGESICQKRSWPPDILKHFIMCGMLGLLSGILVTLKCGLFYSIFGSPAVSNVLRKQNTFFSGYKNNTYSLYRNWKRQKNIQKKILPPRDIDLFLTCCISFPYVVYTVLL